MPHEIEVLYLLELREHGFVHERLWQHVLHNFHAHLLLLHQNLVSCHKKTLLLRLTEFCDEVLLLLNQYTNLILVLVIGGLCKLFAENIDLLQKLLLLCLVPVADFTLIEGQVLKLLLLILCFSEVSVFA